MTSMTLDVHLKLLKNIYQFQFTDPKCHQSRGSNDLWSYNYQEILFNFQKLKILIPNYFLLQSIQETYLK